MALLFPMTLCCAYGQNPLGGRSARYAAKSQREVRGESTGALLREIRLMDGPRFG